MHTLLRHVYKNDINKLHRDKNMRSKRLLGIRTELQHPVRNQLRHKRNGRMYPVIRRVRRRYQNDHLLQLQQRRVVLAFVFVTNLHSHLPRK